MSSSKTVSSILMAMLVDKGLIEYDQPIAKYWPEFAQNGKDRVTVSDLMRHESGLPVLHKKFKPEDLFLENIKKNSVGEVIETDTQVFPGDGSVRMYHTLTRGWIENEIFRRVFPGGLTMGEFLKQELNPFANTNIVCGAKEEDFEKLVYFEALGTVKGLTNMLYHGPERAPVIGTLSDLTALGPILTANNAK